MRIVVTTSLIYFGLTFLTLCLCLESPLIAFAEVEKDTANGTFGQSTANYNDLSKLTRCEQILFFTTHKSLPSERRLESLEMEVFGHKQKGNFSARVGAIYKIVAVDNRRNMGSLLLPPLAPHLDHTGAYGINGNEVVPVQEQKSFNENTTLPREAPNRYQIILKQAVNLYTQGKINEAEQRFQEVIKLDKQNVDAYYNLGAIAEGKGDLKNALTYYRQAQRLSPDDHEIAQATALVQSRLLGQLKDSSANPVTPAKNLSAGQATKNNFAELRRKAEEAAIAYRKGDYDTAIQILQQVDNVIPNNGDVKYAMAQAYRGKGQYMEARSLLKQAISINPRNSTYVEALNDLDHSIANSDMPNQLPARPYEAFASNTGASNSDASNNAFAHSLDSQSDISSAAPPGQITPFSHNDLPPDSESGWQSMNSLGNGFGNNGYEGSSGRIAGFYPGYAYRNSGVSSTSRIERAAVGGLAGAAMGSLFGGGYYGRSRGSSALTGALVGGMFGLLVGH